MLAVISPHLDDAVFGCGELLAARPGAVAITVCAAVPDDACMLPEWDAACGFGSAREAQLARRCEDRAALDSLQAKPCWLWCWDSQYRRRAETVEEVALKLARALRRCRAQTIAIPLGLFHSDHKLTHLAALKLMSLWRQRLWLAYEEPNYRRIPQEVPARLAALAQAGITPVQHDLAGDPRLRNLKACAVRRYESQLRGLGSAGRPGSADLYAPERYWRLSM